MGNEKDKALIEAAIIKQWTEGERQRHVPNRQLVADLLAVLATVRAEEREAACKVLCPDCTEGDTPTLDNQARWFYHRYGHDDVVGCSASKLRLAAAENRKGEG